MRGSPGPPRPSVNSPRYLLLAGEPPASDQPLGDLEADVVGAAGVLRAGIAQPDHQPVDARAAAAGGRHDRESLLLGGFGRLAAVVRGLGLGSGLALAHDLGLRSISFSSSSWRRGAVIVATTVSGSSSSVTPRGEAIDSSVSVSPMSSVETSCSSVSGMSPGSASIVSSRVTCSSTPPCLTPGASSMPVSSSTTVDWIASVEADAQQVEVDGRPGHRVADEILEHHRACRRRHRSAGRGPRPCGPATFAARARRPRTRPDPRHHRRRRRGCCPRAAAGGPRESPATSRGTTVRAVESRRGHTRRRW